ncbi:MAG: ATP synthase F1 subunit delta [Bacteroidia bacterium]|nr:ATP synthase F1 subunit delta [Bacteroidia bacterium]
MQARVAKRYAKALFDLATEKNSLDAVYNDINLINDSISDSKDLGLLLKTPIVTSDRKEKVMDSLFGGKVNELTHAYLKLIVGKGRESAIPDIASEFISQYKNEKGITTANVTTAVPLHSDTKSAIVKLIEDATKMQVELVDKVDADMIGGYIIKVGDRQFDTSINRKLEELKREFSENIYLKDY